MKCADDYFKFLCKWILENCSKDLEFVSKRIDRTCVDRLQSVISIYLEKITYTEAVKVLEKVKLTIPIGCFSILDVFTSALIKHKGFLLTRLQRKYLRQNCSGV